MGKVKLKKGCEVVSVLLLCAFVCVHSCQLLLCVCFQTLDA